MIATVFDELSMSEIVTLDVVGVERGRMIGVMPLTTPSSLSSQSLEKESK
jgi:hypothetical protein